MTVRTRIAPSPTGDPHVGTGYMGLVNMVLARQHGGQFLLRIDDTDRTRYRAGSEQAVFDALRWLGLEWDEGPDKGGPCGPYRQSERTAIYLEHALMLVKSGHAYRCFCTSDELAARRAEALAEKRDFRGYDGRCRALDPEDAERRAGEPHVIRFKCPTDEGKTVIQDLLRGPIETPNAELDDKVLLKSDGFPTYHLASVVDDHLFRISHIIRAEEWIPSGPLHQLLFEAYGWDVPVFCHMPLIRNADKSKISKRKNPTSLLYYRDAGYLPQALLNFLGLLGWGGPKTADGGNQEIFSVDDMLQHFKLETLSLGGPVFDLAKLRHVNAHYLRELQPQAFAQQVRDYLVGDPAYLEALVPLVSPRMETLGQFLHRLLLLRRGPRAPRRPQAQARLGQAPGGGAGPRGGRARGRLVHPEPALGSPRAPRRLDRGRARAGAAGTRSRGAQRLEAPRPVHGAARGDLGPQGDPGAVRVPRGAGEVAGPGAPSRRHAGPPRPGQEAAQEAREGARRADRGGGHRGERRLERRDLGAQRSLDR